MSGRKLNLRRASDTAPFVVSILSGKGGVGKSVIAFNLAERLSRFGKALLIDNDIFIGNAHILANVQCDFGWPEYVSGKLSFLEALATIDTSFGLLASPKSPALDTHPAASNIASTMQRLSGDAAAFDWIVIDHPSGISEQVIVATLASDQAVIVLVPELTSISDAFGLYKHLSQTDSHSSPSILINRVESADEADFLYGKFAALSERFLGGTPANLGFLSENSSWRTAVARQKPVASVAPESLAVKELNILCELIVKNRAPRPESARRQLQPKTNYQPA